MSEIKTIIQLMEGDVYPELAVLPFLYEKPKNTGLFIDEKEYIVDHMRDKIKSDGSIKRLIRVYLLRK